MATGGVDPKSVDSRVVCSVCLEPYKGRQPKLLPCFHTFCLPCLTELQLASKQQASLQVSHTDDVSNGSITCPTCRKDIPVPPGGVQHFQSNFYLDDENDQGTPRNAENVDDDDLGVKAREQADLLEKVMDVLEEEEGSMDRERRAIENAIHSMYTAGLDLLAEARDESLASLKDAAKVGRDALQQELIGVRDLHTALSQLASRGVTSQTSKAKLKAKVMNNTDVRRFQQRLSDGVRKNTLTHKTDGGNSSSMLEQFRSYIGRVVPASQASEPSLAEPTTPEEEGADAAAASKQSSGSDLPISDVQHVDLEELIRSQNELRAVVDKLREQMNMLQPANTLVSQNVASLNEKMASLSTEFVSSQKQTASLQREVEKQGDKGAILREDLATLQTESSAMRQDLTKVTSDQSKFHQDLTSLQTENSVLRSQMVSLQDTTDALRKTAKQHEERLNMPASSDSQATPLQKTVTKLQDSLRNGSTRISQLEAQFATMNTVVAFHVRLNRDVKLRDGKKIFFREEVYNTGDHYDPYDGIFRAPVSGTYIFMATGCHSSEGNTFDIVHEDEWQAGSYSGEGKSGTTCHAILEVKAGDHVYVECTEDCTFESNYTHFSGALLKPDV